MVCRTALPLVTQYATQHLRRRNVNGHVDICKRDFLSRMVCPTAMPLVTTRTSPSPQVNSSGRSTAAIAVGSCTYIASVPYESLQKGQVIKS